MLRDAAILFTAVLTACGGIADRQLPQDTGDDDGIDAGFEPEPEPEPFCGDDTCDRDENCVTCVEDCGECPPGCNDGSCDGGETCTSCPLDCGLCPPECYNDECEVGETCSVCPEDCGPCIPLPPSLLPTIQALRPLYSARPSPEQLTDLLNRVAWQHRAEGWGLLRKPGGTRCRSLLHGFDTSCDILVNEVSIWHFDVLIAAGEQATPAWQDVGPCRLGPESACELSNFVDPVQPGEVPP